MDQVVAQALALCTRLTGLKRGPLVEARAGVAVVPRRRVFS
jgi:hypothetical protein